MHSKAKRILAKALIACSLIIFNPVSAGAQENCNIFGNNIPDTPGCSMDFSGQDLHGRSIQGDLFHANFSGANLSGASFHGGILFNANFTNANLTDVVFGTSNIHYVNFYEANLENVVFTSAVSIGMVTSGGIKGEPKTLPLPPNIFTESFNGYKIQNGFYMGPSTCLKGDLGVLDLSNTTRLPKTCGAIGFPLAMPESWRYVNGIFLNSHAKGIENTDSCDLSDGDLSNFVTDAYLVGCDFSGVNLEGADLSGAQIWGSSSGGITGEPKELPTGYYLVNGYLIGPDMNLKYANLAGVDFSSMNLVLTDMRFADLTGAVFNGANLDRASLTWANLDGVKSGAVTGIPSGFSAGWGIQNGYLIGPNADLSDVDLTSFDLRDLDLSGINFSNADLRNQDLTGANLEGSIMQSANLLGVKADLFYGAPSSLPEGWALKSQHLVGKGARLVNAYLGGSKFDDMDLSGADFSGANFNMSTFKGANFTDANVSGADFSNANLEGAVGQNIRGEPALMPRLWRLSNGKFLREFDLLRAPSVSGSYRVGSIIRLTLGDWGTDTTSTIAWYRDGLIIQNATNVDYQVRPEDFGRKICASVTASKDGYINSTVTTQQSSPVSKGLFSATPVPKIVGTLKVGNTVNVYSKAWAAGALIKYQWMLDGKPIKSATSSKFLISSKIKGKQLSISVTQSLTGYIAVTKNSVQVKIR